MQLKQYLVLACLLLFGVAALLAACGTEPVEESAPGGYPVEETEITRMPTVDASRIYGILFLGEVSPPDKGPTVIFVHEDDTVDFVFVITNDIGDSRWMTGTLEGQRINVSAEPLEGRAIGRFEAGKIEMNITMQAAFIRTTLNRTEGGGLYKGELNELIAGLILLPDGTVYGFAAIEGGEAPVYEALCVEGIEGAPEAITATTCDTGVEVTLTLVKE